MTTNGHQRPPWPRSPDGLDFVGSFLSGALCIVVGATFSAAIALAMVLGLAASAALAKMLF